MAKRKAQLQLVAAELQSPLFETIIALGAYTAMLGVLFSQILGISRMLFAMGRNTDFFPIFQKISEKK